MSNLKLKRTAAFVLALSIPLATSGCSKKSGCELPSRHFHLYIKDSNLGTISKYIDSENTDYWGYEWTPDYIEVTKEDEKAFDAMYGLYDGKDNWDYVFNYMKHKSKDWFEFYYKYYTEETETYEDSDGKTRTKTKRVKHSGWSTDPTHRGNTGETRLYHNRFYGYRIVFKNGKYIKERSNDVDDVRDIIDDYPYFDEEFSNSCYHTFNFSSSRLTSLNVEDFYDYFNHPRLDTKDIYIENEKVKTI